MRSTPPFNPSSSFRCLLTRQFNLDQKRSTLPGLTTHWKQYASDCNSIVGFNTFMVSIGAITIRWINLYDTIWAVYRLYQSTIWKGKDSRYIGSFWVFGVVKADINMSKIIWQFVTDFVLMIELFLDTQFYVNDNGWYTLLHITL